jgi:hypothetical protein
VTRSHGRGNPQLPAKLPAHLQKAA